MIGYELLIMRLFFSFYKLCLYKMRNIKEFIIVRIRNIIIENCYIWELKNILLVKVIFCLCYYNVIIMLKILFR